MLLRVLINTERKKQQEEGFEVNVIQVLPINVIKFDKFEQEM